MGNKVAKNLFPEMMESFLPPCIANILGKSWAVFNSVWYRIPTGTTVEEVRKYWIPVDPYGVPIAHTDISDMNGKWEVPSSKKDTDYTVKLINGTYYCVCKGYNFRKDCRHIKEVVEGRHVRVT